MNRQSLDDAWWTGPIVAAGAATLPQGHALIEPYVYDAITRGRYDNDGNYRSTDTVHSYGSLTYMLYGVTRPRSRALVRRRSQHERQRDAGRRHQYGLLTGTMRG